MGIGYSYHHALLWLHYIFFFEREKDSLPNAEGSLSLKVPESVVYLANTEVEAVILKLYEETKQHTLNSRNIYTPSQCMIWYQYIILEEKVNFE